MKFFSFFIFGILFFTISYSTQANVIDAFEAPSTYPEGLVYDGTYLWSTSIMHDTIYKLNPNNGEVIFSFVAPGDGPMDLAWDGEYLWGADYGTDKIYKFDVSGNVLFEFDTPGEQPMGLTWDGEYLWHTDYTFQKIYKLDSSGNILYEFDSPGTKPHGLAWDGEYLWNSDAETFKIYKLDTSGNVLATLDVPQSYSYPTGLAINENILWMAARDTGMIYKIDISSVNVDTEQSSHSSSGLADSPWPMFMGNLQHTGLSPYNTSHVDGTVKWSFNTGSSISSSPVIAKDGTIYVGNEQNDMYAINPDGSLKWVYNAGEPVESEEYPGFYFGIISTPAIGSDGTIYFTSLSNYLFALNPDGTEKWKFPIKRSDTIWNSPAIGEDGTIYVGSHLYEVEPYVEVGYIFALNPDGTEKWKFATKHIQPSTAISKDGSTIYVGGAANVEWQSEIVGQLNALDKNGNLLWVFHFEDWQESSPTIGEDGTIYIGSKEGKIYAINSDGTEKWSYKVNDEVNISKLEEIEYVDFNYINGVSAVPAIGEDGTIYVGSWNSYFYAFNPDGTVKWKFKTPEAYEAISSSAAIGSDGTIYFGTTSGYFYAVNPDGTEKWKFKGPMIGGIVASPAIGKDGTVYMASGSDGHLYAFTGPKPELDTLNNSTDLDYVNITNQENTSIGNNTNTNQTLEGEGESEDGEQQENGGEPKKNFLEKILDAIVSFFNSLFG